MPPKDSFFIRAEQTTTADGIWQNNAIDLGAFVDALGQTVLRIHNVQVRYQTAGTNGPPIPDNLPSGGSSYVSYALTTEALGINDILTLNNKSVISSGSYEVATNGPAGAAATDYYTITSEHDLSPQEWTNGYLVGVETIYLNSYQDAQMGPDENTISIVLECTSEKLTKSAAMALALSQQ